MSSMINSEVVGHHSNSKGRVRQHHVAVFAFPFGSHDTPLLNITRRLATIAPPGTVQFSFFSTPNSINSLFPTSKDGGKLEFPNIKPYAYQINWGEGLSNPNPMEEIDAFFKEAAALECLKKAVAAAEAAAGEKVSCVMGDAFLWFLGDLAQEIGGVPWVSCWVSGEHSLSVHVYTDLIRRKFGALTQGIEGREEDTLDFIPGLSKIRVKDLPDGVVTGDLDSTFSRMLHKMGRVLSQATAVCISSCEEWDPIVTNDLKSKFSKVLTVGPLNLVMGRQKVPDKNDCLGWLDRQRPNSVVYVSFGSAASPPPKELVALAEALQSSGFNFLWSLKDPSKVHLPNGLVEKSREKGKVVPWVPQIDVLAHEAVGVFITHFGYNSITESIAAEVPMIGRPFFGDQKLNGRLVEAVWGIGLEVEGGVFTKEGVLKGLDHILYDGVIMRQNIRRLRELVGNAVAPHGTSFQNFNALLQLVTNP